MTDVGPALLRLAFEIREAIILSAAAKVSDLEIAGICGCSPKTVRSKVQMGRLQLAQILNVELLDEESLVAPPAGPIMRPEDGY